MKKMHIILCIIMLASSFMACGQTEDKNNLYEWATDENYIDPSTISVGGYILDKNKTMISAYEDDAAVYDGTDMEFYVCVTNDGKREATVCMSAMIEGELQPYVIEGEDEKVYSSTAEIAPGEEHIFHLFLNPTNVDISGNKLIKFIQYVSAGIERVKEDMDQPVLFSEIGMVKIKAVDKTCEKISEREVITNPIESVKEIKRDMSLAIALKRENEWTNINEATEVDDSEKLYAALGGVYPDNDVEIAEYTMLQYVDGKLVENIVGGHQLYFKSEKDIIGYYELNMNDIEGEHLVAILAIPSKYDESNSEDVLEKYKPIGGLESVVDIINKQ